MSAVKFLALPFLLLASVAPAFAAQEIAPSLAHHLRGLPVSNAILTSILVTVIVTIGIRWLVGKPKLVPTRGQSVFESLIITLRDMLEPIVGKKAMPAAFPVLLCLFIFILAHNWSGLFPFVGTMGWFVMQPDGTEKLIPLLRPHTSEANGTLALSLFSFGAWLVLIFKYAGPKLIWHDLFGNKAGKNELHPAMYYFLSVVFFLVGMIELISIGMRPVTLSARLFGNIFGGENLLHSTHYIFIFYFLEIIVGLVQAFVFTLLSAVYIGLICNHGDEHHDEAHGHDETHKEAAH